MLKKLRSFLAALLLVPVLTLNANAFTADAPASAYAAPEIPQQTSNACWVYFMGRWILIPC